MVLRGTVATFSELVTYLPWLGPLSFKALPLDIAIDAIEFLHEGVELLLLLTEVVLAGKDVRLALTLVLFFFIGGLLVPSIVVIWRGRCHEADPFYASLASELASVESWLKSSSSKSRTDVGRCPMTATRVEDRASATFVLVCLLRLGVGVRVTRKFRVG
jgi:hypothetical protein